MGSGIQLHQLGFDPADLADSQNVGAYLRAGTDGELIESTSNALHVLIQNASIAVTATDLDIRDLTHVSDSVKVGDGSDFLAVNADGSINAVVTATDLDIRDLTHVSDSVKVGDGSDFLAINTDGSINVSFSANDTVANDELTVGTTEVELVAASPVANRRYILIQNMSSNSIYVGATGLTTSDGIQIPKNGNLALDASAGVYAIAGTAGNSVRILELGYGS